MATLQPLKGSSSVLAVHSLQMAVLLQKFSLYYSILYKSTDSNVMYKNSNSRQWLSSNKVRLSIKIEGLHCIAADVFHSLVMLWLLWQVGKTLE